MESPTTFLDCPAYLDEQGIVRCGLPAEVKRRFILRSTDGPLESVMISCPAGHFFNAPIEYLSLEKYPGTARSPSALSGPPCCVPSLPLCRAGDRAAPDRPDLLASAGERRGGQWRA